MKATLLSRSVKPATGKPVIGVFAPCDPRIDAASRERSTNIIKHTAESLAGKITLPDGTAAEVVYSDVLIDAESQADQVARQFKEAGVSVLVCVPDTWSFPQLTTISLLSHFPKDIPINFTTGNSATRPGVVYTHATSGAIAQYGKLTHINVGKWPDEGQNPQMSAPTLQALVDWCYAAVTFQGLKGKRVVVFGHDSMGMETALPHIMETRNQFGIEVTRLDMKLLADMLKKESYDKTELKKLRAWLEEHAGDRIELPEGEKDSELLDQSLALYLIVRDLMREIDAVGGGFMSQLEWGSDDRGIQLPVADIMESLFNSTFDHNGPKAVQPFATEADVQALLTQLFMTWLSGGHPPLFMDFRKAWDKEDITELAAQNGYQPNGDEPWLQKGFVDGVNSGSASFNWAAVPGTEEKEIMKKITFPKAVDYFYYLGNSVHFISPGNIKGLAARLAYSSLSGMFSMIWDEAETVALPVTLAQKICDGANPTWPHTFVVPKYASMTEYKQYAPANHFHMTWDLAPARLQFWMDFCNVLSVAPWQERPAFIEETDRPVPLLYLLNGGEDATKKLKAGKH
ncbi:hypothetical protein DN752_12420 [Echinicola strongylocentroti]|uniref:L-fucose isomerase n=1 Tax=Echinicola strongylocentroti TaxID=1795355 RepID=A0A2Z4IK15_9BACT|nr:hypothetical protein [Echinicola strongylocentroti]AWW30868.1 hypothetical protein DN752_12420 [Echinicola strongylocentroti]